MRSAGGIRRLAQSTTQWLVRRSLLPPRAPRRAAPVRDEASRPLALPAPVPRRSSASSAAPRLGAVPLALAAAAKGGWLAQPAVLPREWAAPEPTHDAATDRRGLRIAMWGAVHSLVLEKNPYEEQALRDALRDDRLKIPQPAVIGQL